MTNPPNYTAYAEHPEYVEYSEYPLNDPQDDAVNPYNPLNSPLSNPLNNSQDNPMAPDNSQYDLFPMAPMAPDYSEYPHRKSPNYSKYPMDGYPQDNPQDNPQYNPMVPRTPADTYFVLIRRVEPYKNVSPWTFVTAFTADPVAAKDLARRALENDPTVLQAVVLVDQEWITRKEKFDVSFTRPPEGN